MNNGKVNWAGNFVALATPFTKDGAIDEGMFRANIELLRSEGADGFVVCGCTGEVWSLENEEKLRLFRIARETAGPGVPVIGGATLVVTSKAVEFGKASIAAGCDGVLLMPPYYAVPGEREIKEYFRRASGEIKSPIFLYNMPKRTGINLAPSLIAELSKLEWIVALKQSTNDFNELEATLAECGDRISVFAGHSAERGFSAVMLGCPGFVSSMESQVMGKEAISMYRLARERKVEAGTRVQRRSVALDVAMRKVGTFPANMKAAMNLLGRPGGHCRQPLLDLNAEERAKVAAILVKLGLLKQDLAA
jgi:4-hydroxy-tetrahydrodipicolinate synthase